MQQYADPVVQQAVDLPTIYGNVDFDVVPERLDVDATPNDERFQSVRKAVDRVFEQPTLMETIRNATMTGDRVAVPTPRSSRNTASER